MGAPGLGAARCLRSLELPHSIFHFTSPPSEGRTPVLCPGPHVQTGHIMADGSGSSERGSQIRGALSPGEGAKSADPWALLQVVWFCGSGGKLPNVLFKKLPRKDIWAATVGSSEVPQACWDSKSAPSSSIGSLSFMGLPQISSEERILWLQVFEIPLL